MTERWCSEWMVLIYECIRELDWERACAVVGRRRRRNARARVIKATTTRESGFEFVARHLARACGPLDRD